MNILDQICNYKKLEVERLKKKISLDFLKKTEIKPLNFIESLKLKSPKKYNVITEIKRKSPSAGLIRKNFNLIDIARDYEKAGAKCLSILTEKKYFGGEINFLKKIKNKVNIPLLRKDFIIDEWQIYESLFYGADCILLILSILNDDEFKKLYAVAKKLGLGVIVEVHDQIELDRALSNNVECIGVNNRNLKTLKIDLEVFRKLSSKIPRSIVKVCESGISNNNQLKKMTEFGADAFLIGESLMKKENIYQSTKELIHND